ncbi:ion transporter, partial [Streptomyces sp. YC504]
MRTEHGLRRRRALAARARTLVEADWFSAVVVIAILSNATVLGVETYSGLAERWNGQLAVLEHGFLALFTAEILLRAAAHADRPADFFRSPWNIFDTLVVLCAFLPVTRDNTTVLRLLRLVRVLRTARFLPQLRVILLAFGKSAPGTASFLMVGSLVLYLYAMLGWICFGAEDPERYGTLGRAALTLFVLMTLDGLGEAVQAGQEISSWSFLYYGSYVLFSSFLLVNLLIGVVINSLEQAREQERQIRSPSDGAPAPPPATTTAAESVDPDRLRARIAHARKALDDLEHTLPP